MLSTVARAVGWMVALFLPSSWAKKLGETRVTVTVTESLDVRFDVFWIEAVSPGFLLLSNCWTAVFCATPQLTGSCDAPASAAASAVDCTARLSWYHSPTSIASAHIPSSTNMKTVISTTVCPRSSPRADAIRHTPYLDPKHGKPLALVPQ